MNDGSTDYRNHHAVDSLAFGHCDYAYRNLGRPSIISIKHEANNFAVDVDGRQCFSSNKVRPSLSSIDSFLTPTRSNCLPITTLALLLLQRTLQTHTKSTNSSQLPHPPLPEKSREETNHRPNSSSNTNSHQLTSNSNSTSSTTKILKPRSTQIRKRNSPICTTACKSWLTHLTISNKQCRSCPIARRVDTRRLLVTSCQSISSMPWIKESKALSGPCETIRRNSRAYNLCSRIPTAI